MFQRLAVLTRRAEWGSEATAEVARFLMEVEEEGVATEYIPEWARARLCGVDGDLEKRTMHLQCIRGVGEFATHKEVVRHLGRSSG